MIIGMILSLTEIRKHKRKQRMLIRNDGGVTKTFTDEFLQYIPLNRNPDFGSEFMNAQLKK